MRINEKEGCFVNRKEWNWWNKLQKWEGAENIFCVTLECIHNFTSLYFLSFFVRLPLIYTVSINQKKEVKVFKHVRCKVLRHRSANIGREHTPEVDGLFNKASIRINAMIECLLINILFVELLLCDSLFPFNY